MSTAVQAVRFSRCSFTAPLALLISLQTFHSQCLLEAQQPRVRDAKNVATGNPDPARDPKFQQHGIYAATAPRPGAADPMTTSLPLTIPHRARIAFVGNMLLERAQHFGHFEALLHQHHPSHELVIRNLAWPADTSELQPRPDNFADLDQHLHHERADIIVVAFGFNESFDGAEGLPAFRNSLSRYLSGWKTKAFNGRSAPKIVLLSPIASENVQGVPAADLNDQRLEIYSDAMRDVASELEIGFIDLFTETKIAMASPGSDFTINGVHLDEAGYELFASLLFRQLFDQPAPPVRDDLREAVIDKNRQYFRRYRPLNTFYYTGGRSKTYGYLDFLPAMQNFDIMTANREQRIWDLAQGKPVPNTVDDSNLPPMPETKQSRGVNRWMSAADEQQAFKVDPRFEVNLFAGEEQFPEIAAPIQMRWDNRGRLWVSCSTTYPHVYPGKEPNDSLVILEDTDGDGRADTSTVFADDLHIPLSFEFGDGGVYVSEEPHLTFLKDTDGDGEADVRRRLLSGFGTEDSHHSLHDFAWTPGGELIFRESIFHHSQVETAYGPVRQQNSGWFLFEPRSQRLTSFGTYPSTNPWGVTFDDWGQHVASHPVFAAAFHSLDPPYPVQHPKPSGLRAYSGTCGQEFVDFATFPDDMQGGYIKARYKPTNRIEIHRWVEGPFGYDEEYVSDLIFSTNLSFIPVDIRFGPRGAMYVCDWYNPVKGHAQYSLRDERRDRHSGRIWRITAKGMPLQDPPPIAEASIEQLLDQLRRRESRIRYWVRRELRQRDPVAVEMALSAWVAGLSDDDARLRHHQIEAVWVYRGAGAVNTPLLRELLACDNHHARAAATRQLRHWHSRCPDAIDLLRRGANDPAPMVRMEAAIAASYIGTKDALDAMLEVMNHPREGHLAYAITCALGSHSLRRHWDGDDQYNVAGLIRDAKRRSQIREPTASAQDAQFDSQTGLMTIKIHCLPEVMKFSKEQFAVKTGQPVKIVFTNSDATDHNMVFVQPGALEEVGMAANEMARDPRNANSNFIPPSKRKLILQASKMIGPTRKSRVHVFRFNAPAQPGVYPYVCTFPGHWVVMKGVMVVADDLQDVDQMLAASRPKIVREWKMDDFKNFTTTPPSEESVMRGMTAFAKANCDQCHVLAGHGVNLGPDLQQVSKRFKDEKLLRQLLEPSSEIHEKHQTYQFLMSDGRVITGVIASELPTHFMVISNLLTPAKLSRVDKSEIDESMKSTVSAMPAGLVNVLTREEIENLMTYLQSDGYQLPDHLRKTHDHGKHSVK